jgi:hypothetical protein
VFNFVKLAELYYAGSHGMDIKGPTAQSKHTKAKVSSYPCLSFHQACTGLRYILTVVSYRIWLLFVFHINLIYFR